jgi:class 3 adenylate cyclase/pimeloyl-ACP methyl ester carboxylesterase
MDQQIRFCTTSDGVTIAYSTVGEGPPLLYANGWPGHLAIELEAATSRGLIESIGRGVTLVRYDMRGSGLSDRDAVEVSIENSVKDLEAVVEALGLGEFWLLSLGLMAGPIAMTYAAANPGRVSKMVLSGPYLRGEDLTTPERGRALADYIEHFGFPMTLSNVAPEELANYQEVARIQREGATLEVQGAVVRAILSADVTDTVDRITMPALVLQGQRSSQVPFEQARAVATALPNARFVLLDDTVDAPWRIQEIIAGEMRSFLGVEDAALLRPAAPATEHAQGAHVAVHTILFTDLTSSTELTQRLGDEPAQHLVRAHNDVVRTALRAHDGTEIKHTGDGIMASFHSASQAIQCAVDIQRAVEHHNESDTSQVRHPLQVHLGLNAGEPVSEGSDLFGTAVQLAKRICDHAEANEIMVSDVVRQLAAGKGFLFSDRGVTALKGFDEPVKVWEVRWRDE